MIGKARGIVAVACLFALAGCYDSTWGQAKASQRRSAQAATPSLSPNETSTTPKLVKPAKKMRIRVIATPRYAAETLDWHKQVQELIDDADDVLGPDAGIKIEIDSMGTWDDLSNEDLTKGALDALHAKDDGHDVDWVAGFIGGISKVDPSFHELGIGDQPGKYVILRATNLAGERDEIDRTYDRLSEYERTRLFKSLKQHRAVGVFLHEIGHSLGALHEADPTTIMSPAYDSKVDRYSPAALALMHVSLEHRDHLESAADWTSYASDLLGVLDGPSKDAWIPAERDDFAKRLHDVVDHNRPPASPPPAPDPTPQPATPTAPEPAASEPLLAAKDQPIYAHAVELFRAGDTAGASATAKPLYKAYPKVISVQDLRCQIAMKEIGWPGAAKECAPIQKLSR